MLTRPWSWTGRCSLVRTKQVQDLLSWSSQVELLEIMRTGQARGNKMADFASV